MQASHIYGIYAFLKVSIITRESIQEFVYLTDVAQGKGSGKVGDLFSNILSQSELVRTVEDFKEWTRKSIRPIFPHETLGCGYGRIHAGGVGVDGIIAVDYPIEHLKGICNKAGGLDTPILRRWLVTREPQLFEADSPWSDVPAEWLEQFNRNEMRNAAAHAVYDTERCIGTYHSFHRIPGKLNSAHVEVLKTLAPIMHEVLCRLIGDLNETRKVEALRSTLTPREQQVFALVGQGKANAEIAQILSLSDTTIKHRLSALFLKLNVENRSQLVRLWMEFEARAQMEYGLKIN